MKKLIFCTLTFLTIALLNSCTEKTAGVDSFQFDIYSWEWQPFGTAGTADYSYIASYDIPEITQDVVTNGTVLGYIGGSQGWIALPFTTTSNGWSTNINYLYVVGGVGLTIKDTDLLTVAPSTTTTFKMVVITPKQKPLLNGVNPNDYEAVSDALQLDK